MSKNVQNLISNQDILEAIQTIDRKFTVANEDILSAVNTSFTAVAAEMHEMKQDISGIKGEISGIKQEIVGIKETIVTKDQLKKELVKVVTKEYLDDKLADFKADIVGLIRKEDHKVNTVVSILQDHQVLSEQDMQQINQVQLFANTTNASIS